MAEPPPAEIPPEEPEPEEEPAKLDWDKGFVFEKSGEKGTFKTVLTFRVETLLDTTIAENADGDRQADSRFMIQRGRISLDGHVFTKKLGYKFQADWGQGNLTLKDFYFDAQVADKAWIRAGQWKRFFSRQQINSSGRLELTTRAITDRAFRGNRDIGVAIHNNYEKSPEGIEWAAGVFNGTTDKAAFSGGVVDPDDMTVTGGAFTNVPKAFMPALVARVGYNKGGIKGYSEADLEGGPMRFAVGASVHAETDLDRDSKRQHMGEVDAIMKNNGFAASGAFYIMQNDLEAEDADTTDLGFHVQASKVLGEGTKRMVPAARYAMVITGDTKATHELVAGFGIWPYGHNCKLILDVGTQFDAKAEEGPFDRTFVRLNFAAGMF